MVIEKKCNFIGIENFKAKDGRIFHNASFLVDDDTVKCQFVSDDNVKILERFNRLDYILARFNIYEIPSDNSSKVYGIKLVSAGPIEVRKS